MVASLEESCRVRSIEVLEVGEVGEPPLGRLGRGPRATTAVGRRDIKLLEITSAYYFNFVDCLTAVTPRIRVRRTRGKVFLG